MASKLKIIPLGGLGEIGKNLTVYEYGKDMFLVDCGMGFPDQDLYGVDMVIPDISYLKANKNRIRGMVITHGHEDHIGAIPYVLKQLDMPIYATPLTAAIIELKLEEHDLLYHTQIFTKKPGDRFKLGCFEIEFIHTNHSIADSVALAIKTPIGTVIHTGDFKIDLTPIQGGMIDLPRLGQLGNEGVLALLSDSTNVERPGYCASEARVIDCFDELFKDAISASSSRRSHPMSTACSRSSTWLQSINAKSASPAAAWKMLCAWQRSSAMWTFRTAS